MDLSKSIENWVDHITRILSDNNTKQYKFARHTRHEEEDDEYATNSRDVS